jgi:hypothetical protein
VTSSRLDGQQNADIVTLVFCNKETAALQINGMKTTMLGSKALPVLSRKMRADRNSSSFKSRSILGALFHRCQVGPFCRRKIVYAPEIAKSLSTPKQKIAVVHDHGSASELEGSFPAPSANSHKCDPPFGIASETEMPLIDSSCMSKAEDSVAPRKIIKRNHVIVSDSSSDNDCSARAIAENVQAPLHTKQEGDIDNDSIDLVTFSEDESSDDMFSDDNDFINDESSSVSSSSSTRPPCEAEHNPIILKKKRNPMPPCERCGKKDGERFRCSECSRSYHEVCGGPGPSCTLCSECASALGIDPTQLSSDSDSNGDVVSSVSSSSSDDNSSSSESSNPEYECVVCLENDCGYIRACRVCGKRAHEYCGGPGPLHRKCDRYCPLTYIVLQTSTALISSFCPFSCMKQSNQRLPKRGSSKVVELGVDSSSDCSPSDDGGCSSEGSDSDACVVCGETDGDIRICKGCSRLFHEICGGPGPCHKLCDMCSATLAKPQSKRGLHGMVEL